ncbi:hypothetical protein SAMN00120144_2591 [Hymenobacter roseosalivarius DSM 11622]|uniref:Uncharacterized protein n=1 Tax=Hymenobacter roseosalivarius DSM 11622 TaxID=645990 RepID=A0A1W1VTJ8_9BACT|nr:hypothetical protein [Hymenobacter roseosalivarius]SMB96560.1 hypothetical protein SAMN00120144_2591 [Hymenobacter roseosalivarius DSM 11622]
MKKIVTIWLLGGILGLLAQPALAQLYDVRAGNVSFERKEREALKVQVDGTAQWTRDYWQAWLKDTYNIRLKGDGTFGVGKKDLLVAKQAQVSSVSGKLIDLYSSVIAPADTVAELAVWATLGGNSFLMADQTPSEYAALRTMVQSFAAAARIKAYKDQITEAEKQVKEAEKEREKLEKDILSLQANTTSNLARMEALQKQNVENTLKARQDSVKLVTNAQQLEFRKLRLARRRDRLTTLERK